MPSEKAESDDVSKVEKYGYCIGDQIDKIWNTLWESPENAAWGEAIIKDERQVEYYRDGQIEAHSVEKEKQDFADTGLVEELQVEQVEQPSAQT